ncbi:MAG: hypothetical protein A3C93_05070 [Candidatus Lloydbacteria bacterium RIFCSPHIGHO2_02_FULL_54_17]|uniref:Lycopene cyclase domain-containing protein n=1 Tax=Candidatus Lloydbacteria bacterium RIFCSPHIGHO2_02_FULL_54_17 TaxID=1798664 RepID=A0A1G2DB31_9BACT|nr:MAG: hypothetical protein A2762_06125 [Candidatus Lloydbacteria bacterium RIFCSPHIGHO2_01_FULL_54_11]OGZ10837.1 MAG: hypothetical protein A3C93_05070 [Candidatus Lloydbacteria bacterium RIFCSPHIGHO2_02_FULL_54_17]OGZ13264.1 MAG: hypothetical protein A2948_02965 [Candidatus Lloydbacteria bacterium RIFCSPLOWO2_01_FULL_54_18]OGZ14374.1 MAG: hypothetical protein A3H76_04835 [Candidatus Lloydbacteria bacterium RIFCSPLOWO2_02_FULL_54_12]
MHKFLSVAFNIVPIVVMVGCIPLVTNDFVLAGIYGLVSVVALAYRRQRGDLTVFVFGFFAMTVSEYFFIATGVETFNRVSFLGVMPLWLPFLWAYGFVAMKRAVVILGIE